MTLTENWNRHWWQFVFADTGLQTDNEILNDTSKDNKTETVKENANLFINWSEWWDFFKHETLTNQRTKALLGVGLVHGDAAVNILRAQAPVQMVGRTGCQWLTQAASEPGSNIDPTFSTMWDFFPSSFIISFHKLVLFSFLHLNIVPSDWWFICLALLTQALQERGTEEQINQKLYRMEQYKWKNDNDTSFWKRMIKMDRKTDDRVNIGQSASGRWNGRVFQKLNLSQNVACVRFVEPKIPHDLLGWGTKGIFWPIIHSGLPW